MSAQKNTLLPVSNPNVPAAVPFYAYLYSFSTVHSAGVM